MSLMDMIAGPMGQAALAQVGARVGLSPEMVRMAASALAPAIAGGMAQAGPLPGATPEPGTDDARAHGNDVLGQILGSKDRSRSVAADASAQTGIDVATLKQLLPQLASLAAGAQAGRGGAGGLGGGLGGLLGGLAR
jgi:hypothetical protein